MKEDTLKSTHPEKYWLKMLCTCLYYIGLGEFWYEERSPSRFQKFYSLWVLTSNFYIYAFLANVLFSYMRNDLTMKEKNDLMQFSIAHSLICGIPIRTEVTYFPGKWDTGFLTTVLRVLAEFHWWYLVSILLLIDFVCIFSLTINRFKFKRVRLYFESFGSRFGKGKRKLNEVEELRFLKDFIVGIQLHEDALWCARSVQSALGIFYSVQVVESIGMLAICLLKLVVSQSWETKLLQKIERNFTLILANLIFTLGLVAMTGAYMMAGAEITYEASLVPTAVFHCGWERARRPRPLLLTALQRGQTPVYMTAFGIVILSYSNFIAVLRASYSFFAVMF